MKILKFLLKSVLKLIIGINFFSIIILNPKLVFSQYSEYRFDHITVDEGLSQNTVYCIIRDHKGFMWFGTQDGLNRYTGNSIKCFVESTDSSSIVGRQIFDICEDQNRNIWIGTEKRLNKYDPLTESFQQISNPDNSIDDYQVNSILIDNSGLLWVGTVNGLLIYDIDNYSWCQEIIESVKMKQEEILSLYKGNDNDIWMGTDKGIYNISSQDSGYKKTLKNPSSDEIIVRAIYKDSQDYIWIGTEVLGKGYLYSYDSINIQEFTLAKSFERPITALLQDNNNKLWIGFDEAGISILDKNGTQIEIKVNHYDKRSINDNDIRTIIKDEFGAVWIGTFSGGVNKYDSRKEKFTSYYHDPNFESSLIEDSNYSIYEDQDSIIWIGTNSGYLTKFNPKTKEFTVVPNEKLHYNTILSINEDKRGKLWIGTINGGLYFSTKQNRIDIEKVELDLLGRKYIRIIQVDQDSNYLWIGTQDKGVIKLDPETKEILENYNIENELYSNNVYSIFPDTLDHNIIWIGTNKGGINKLNKTDKSIEKLDNDGKLNAKIYCFSYDNYNSDILWLGTNAGLYKFNRSINKIEKHYTTEKKQLPNDVIYGVVADSRGYLWLSTNNGISRFSVTKDTVESNFNTDNGLQSKEFNSGAYCKSTYTGEIYFGGIKGLSVFHPDSIHIDATSYNSYITKLMVKGKEIKIGDYISDGNFILGKSIIDTKYFEFNYDDFPFKLEFTTVDYAIPSNICYTKLLLKANGDTVIYIPNSEDNYYTFNNLNPGNYIFKVWGSNSDRIINDTADPAVIEFRIFKYNQVLIIISYIIILILFPLILYIVYKQFISRILAERRERLKTEIRNYELENQIEMFNKLDVIKDKLQFKESYEDFFDFFLKQINNHLKFDYSLIYTVDNLRKTISTKSFYTKDKSIVNPQNWSREASFDLTDKDILASYVRKEIKGLKHIYGPEINIDEHIYLNKEIFLNNRHNELDRIFIPIEYVYVPDYGFKEIIVLGVIEAGFHIDSGGSITSELKYYTKRLINDNTLLIKNQLEINKEISVNEIIDKNEHLEDELEFLKNILIELIHIIGADKGEIVFYPLNVYSNMNYPRRGSFKFHDLEESKKNYQYKNEIKVFNYETLSKKSNYNTTKNKPRPDATKNIKSFPSILLVPIVNKNIVMGEFRFFSLKKEYFNYGIGEFSSLVIDKCTVSYLTKKTRQAIASLVLPFQLFLGKRIIFKYINNIIVKYFYTDYVSVWEITNQEKGNFSLNEASEKLHTLFVEYGLKKLGKNIKPKDNKNIQIVYFNKTKKDECRFSNFAKKYNFKSMVYVPLRDEQQTYGFVNIFSNDEIKQLSQEDIAFLNLIATKGAISAQYAKLIESFIRISKSLTKPNLKNILRTITYNAQALLQCDSVLLFWHEPKSDIFNVSISGKLKYPERLESSEEKSRDSHLAKLIMNNSSVYFQNEDDYKKFSDKAGRIINSDNFWVREELKSSSGIRLVHRQKAIGVMFFNYKTEQNFIDFNKRVLEAFSSIAVNAIFNAKYMTSIISEKDILQKKTDLLVDDRDSFYRKVKEMLPLITNTSLYIILRGLNHDLRHFVHRTQQALINIESKDRLYKKERYDIEKSIVSADENMEYISNLIELFDFSKKNPESVDLINLIDQWNIFFKRRIKTNITFKIEQLKKDFKYLECHKSEMTMIIYNLINNAVYAIEKKNIDNGYIKFILDYDKSNYIIIIEDNGVGIKRNHMDRIFESGFTTREDGLGVGLYFVKEILTENYKAEIFCESSFSNWTKFKIFIPKYIKYKEA